MNVIDWLIKSVKKRDAASGYFECRISFCIALR